MNLFQQIEARAKNDTSALARLHPEVLDRVHLVSLTDSEQGAGMAGGFSRAATDYASHVWVHKAVSVIANALAPLAVRVVDRDGQPLERHPVTLALARVNDSMSSADLWRQWATDMLLGGESGLELVKNAAGGLVEVWPRQPTQFTVQVDAARKRYFGVAGYTIKFDALDRGFELPPDEFAHFKFYHPGNPWRGLAPIEAVRMGIVIDQLAQAWSRLFFRNSARPDFAVIAPQGITKSERDDLEAQIMARFGGTANAHKPILLEDGITDIKVLSFPPKDMEWLQQRELSRGEVGAIFGVPDEIMGFGRDTYENFGTARSVLWTLTLVPMIGYRDTTLTEVLQRGRALRPDERIATDTSLVSELQEDLTAKFGQAKLLYEIGVPVNLINDRLGLGFEDVPSGDLPFTGRGAAAGPFGVAPPRALRPVIQKTAILEYNSAEHQARMKEVDDRQEPHVVKMQRKVKRELQRQQNEALRKLRNLRSAGRETVKQTAGEVFDFDAEVDRWTEEFRQNVVDMLDDAAQAEYARLDNGHLAPFDIQRPSVQQAINDVLHEMATKVNNTTFNDLVDLFQEAERAGESIPEMAERLSAYFGGRKSDYETERIARTTMVGADNRGALEAYEQTGVVHQVAWLAALDTRVRDTHADAHGQIRLLGEQFEVGGEKLDHPGDPSGSPENIINCRCALQPIER
jgi:HK97 family phage portal protein